MDFKLSKSNLNFRVYTASAFPSTGNENDIVVISDIPMKNWILSPDVPSGAPRTDGDVWIQYSVTGNTFNVLQNSIMLIAAISAKQYVDGAWVDKTAKSYQEGAWVDVISYNWSKTELSKFWTTGSAGLTVASEPNGLRITRNGTYGVCNSDIPFDITDWDYLHIKFSECTINTSYGNAAPQVGVRDITGDGTYLAYANATVGQASGTLSIPLNGLKSYKKLYVCLSITGGQVGSALIEHIWFE